MAQHETQHRYRPDRPPRRSRQRGKFLNVRKGVGACLFTLGIPLAIAGTIILIVANSPNEQGEVPPSFPILGPILLTLSVLFFAIGSILTALMSIDPCVRFCFPDDPKSFCWKRCPMLFSILRPNDVLLINRREAGLHALQTVPNKPVLKKVSDLQNVPTLKRGVRFSDADSELGESRASASSEVSENGKGEGAVNTSLLSLRHCKIYPKDTEKWLEMNMSQPVTKSMEEGDGDVFILAESAVFRKDKDASTGSREHITDMDDSREPQSEAS